MSRPAVSALRTAISRGIRPALCPARPPSLPVRASSSTRRQKRPAYTIPPEIYFERAAKIHKAKEPTPNEFYRIVTGWQRVQNQKRTDSPDLLQKLNTDFKTFVDAAVFMLLVWGPGQHNTPEAYPQAPLVLSMLRYASDQGYSPATVAYIQSELHCTTPGGNRPPKIPQELLARLDALNSTQGNPESWLTSAQVAMLEGDYPRADSHAAHAIKLANASPSDGLRRADLALILRGHVRRHAGDTKGAESFFREAVRRHGSRDAALELLYDGECPAAVKRDTEMAILCQQHACTRVADAENEFALKMLERGQKRRFLDHQYMAQEWLKLARTKQLTDD